MDLDTLRSLTMSIIETFENPKTIPSHHANLVGEAVDIQDKTIKTLNEVFDSYMLGEETEDHLVVAVKEAKEILKLLEKHFNI